MNNSDWFGTTQVWIKDEIINVFGWTLTFKMELFTILLIFTVEIDLFYPRLMIWNFAWEGNIFPNKSAVLTNRKQIGMKMRNIDFDAQCLCLHVSINILLISSP